MENNGAQLNDVWQKRYRVSRFFVYALFVCAILYVGYAILFPSASFTFSFRNPDSSKNTVVEPRNTTGTLNKNGKVSASDALVFDTNPLGDYTEAAVTLTLEKDSSDITNKSISTRRSYRALFYPDGPSLSTVDAEMLPRLFSANDSVFIASQGKIWPIADAITFVSMGWDWNDVVQSNSEELAQYEKQKLFTLKNPHPDGTVFFDDSTKNYYVIDNGMKRELSDPTEILPKLQMNPVIADTKGLEIKEMCQFKRSFSLSKKYTCTIPIDAMRSIVGNDYQFETALGNEVEIKDIAITFKKTVTAQNLKTSIATLKSRLLSNYNGQNQ